MTVSQPPAIRGLGGEEIPHLSPRQHGPAPAVHAPWKTPEVAATCCRVDGPRAARAVGAPEGTGSAAESWRNKTQIKHVPIPAQGLLLLRFFVASRLNGCTDCFTIKYTRKQEKGIINDCIMFYRIALSTQPWKEKCNFCVNFSRRSRGVYGTKPQTWGWPQQEKPRRS